MKKTVLFLILCIAKLSFAGYWIPPPDDCSYTIDNIVGNYDRGTQEYIIPFRLTNVSYEYNINKVNVYVSSGKRYEVKTVKGDMNNLSANREYQVVWNVTQDYDEFPVGDIKRVEICFKYTPTSENLRNETLREDAFVRHWGNSSNHNRLEDFLLGIASMILIIPFVWLLISNYLIPLFVTIGKLQKYKKLFPNGGSKHIFRNTYTNILLNLFLFVLGGIVSLGVIIPFWLIIAGAISTWWLFLMIPIAVFWLIVGVWVYILIFQGDFNL